MSLLAATFRLATAIGSPAGRGARLSTFIFHRVRPEPDELLPFEPDAMRFYTLLDWIGTQFNVLEPLEALTRLFEGTLPARAAIISFDDGYRDNAEVALPLLRRRGMPAVFFIATGFLEGGVMFNDRVIEAVRAAPAEGIDASGFGLGRLALADAAARAAAIDRLLLAIKHLAPEERDAAVARIEALCGASPPEDLMMSASQVRGLAAAGMRIGGHTRSHPMLSRTSDDRAMQEILGGAQDLEAVLGERPRIFAYPNGRVGRDYAARHAQMVRQAGFQFAFSTEPGVATRNSDPLQLPRFTPWDLGEARFRLRACAVLAKTRFPAAPDAVASH